MSYKDLFGEFSPAPQAEELREREAQRVMDPLREQAEDATGNGNGNAGADAAGGGNGMPSADDGLQPLRFAGFASRLPLLVERPSMFVTRLRASARSIIMLEGESDEHGTIDDRILISPSIALPVFFLYGTELFPNEDVLKYPLLHMPANHQYDGSMQVRDYALTLIALYTAGGIMFEDGSGDLYTYGVDDPFEVDDTAWDTAAEWATMVAEPLGRLNMARLLGFALSDPNTESEPLGILFDTWGETRGVDEIIEDGRKAADEVKPYYDVLTDFPYQPFSEQ